MVGNFPLPLLVRLGYPRMIIQTWILMCKF